MIIVTRPGVTDEELDHIRERIESLGPRTHLIRGEHRTVVLCIGDDADLANVPLLAIPGVESARPVMKPYKLASRQDDMEATEVPFGGGSVGSNALSIIAGPCSVENLAMLQDTARHIKGAGATGLRGGAFKPRSSPYDFDGLGEEGLKMLADVRAETGLPVVTEVMDTRQVDLVAEYADMLQIGARNMQNFSLLTEVGRLHRPILLKRGMSAKIQDLLLAAEYVMKQGNSNVVLCERGIRTFEDATRNTFDLAAIPVLKKETHLPRGGRSQPRRRAARPGAGPLLRGHRGRSRWSHRGGTSRTRAGRIRRGPVVGVRGIRLTHGRSGAFCGGGGEKAGGALSRPRGMLWSLPLL